MYLQKQAVYGNSKLNVLISVQQLNQQLSSLGTKQSLAMDKWPAYTIAHGFLNHLLHREYDNGPDHSIEVPLSSGGFHPET